jgi:hypothetical protein
MCQVVAVAPFAIASLVNTDRSDGHKVLEFQNIIAPEEYNKITDDRLRFVTATAALKIKRMCDSSTGVTWEQLEKVMNECVILERGGDSTVDKMETKTLKNLEDVDGDKSEYIKLWFRDLIRQADPDVYEAMRLNGCEIDRVIKLALKDVGVHDFWSLFANKIYAREDILDIGMIRFPTEEHPYMKLYRVRVSSRADGARILFFGGGMEACVSIELTSRKYYPRMDMFKTLPSDFVGTVISTFEKDLNK